MLLLALTLVLQPPAPRPTAPPAGKAKLDEPKALTGKVELVPAPGSDRPPLTFHDRPAPRVGGGQRPPWQPLPPVKWVLGVYGYDDRAGFVITGTRPVRDLSAWGRVRWPAREVLIPPQVPGGRPTVTNLDPGDTIVAVDGYRVRTLWELVAAVQQAQDKRAVAVDVVDFYTRRPVRVLVRAAREG